jgi:DNA-binding NarL/FixJ family response regulator
VARTLLVVDDHKGLADAIAHLVAADGWDEVHQAESTSGALELAARHRPDLVTVDLTLGREDGIDLLRRLRDDYPHLPLVVLTASGTVDRAVDSLRAGASGFVPKGSDPEHLLLALHAAVEGHTWLPLTLIGPVVRAILDPPPASEWEELVSSLSVREHEVLELMVAGLDRREIADRLTISLNTVRTHVKNILARLGVHSSLEAVSLALHAGMRPASPS